MGLGIDAVTEEQVVAQVVAHLRRGRGGWIATPNVDHLRILSRRPELRAMIGEADLILADGMPLVWASQLQGTPLPQRVPGSGLVLSLSAALAKIRSSIYLLGGNPGEGDTAAEVLKRLLPELKIAGTMCPPNGFESDQLQMKTIRRTLESARPDVVYVCLGFPKQELVIRGLRRYLPATWFLGVGGSLGMISGNTRRAPAWMQGVGLEWVWRLALEPRRLFRRYIVDDLPFAISLLANALAKRCTV
jgi:N-acetylglucosaminyldiphosphoundecaprenol N-acetyl-beta-D-mannosaminyltransferase